MFLSNTLNRNIFLPLGKQTSLLKQLALGYHPYWHAKFRLKLKDIFCPGFDRFCNASLHQYLASTSLAVFQHVLLQG